MIILIDEVMPPLIRREFLQLSLLLLIVPLQYLLTQELKQPDQSKSKILKDIFGNLNSLCEKWFIPEKLTELWGLLAFPRGVICIFYLGKQILTTKSLFISCRSS